MADRGASEVIGFALIFSLVVMSVAVISVSGLNSLQNARDAEQVENAERAFDVLADNVADLHERGAPSRATEIALGQAQLRTGDEIEINVSVTRTGESNPTPVINRSIRPIIYSGNQDRQLVYEAGAVIRENPDGGILVREPPFMTASERVLIPVLSLRSDNIQSLGGSTVLVRTDHRGATVKHASTNSSVQKVTVRIQSPRAAIWADYFEQSGFENCEPSDVVDTVTCEYNPSGEINRVYIVDHDIVVAIDS